jgi:hypothetical protein
VEKYRKTSKKRSSRKKSVTKLAKEFSFKPKKDVEEIKSPEVSKRGARSVPPEHDQQSQGMRRVSKHSPEFPKKLGMQTHSESAKRENGLEAANNDKDSGESSQKVLKLDFQKLKANYEHSQAEGTMKNVKKSEKTKSLWSSSNDVD